MDGSAILTSLIAASAALLGVLVSGWLSRQQRRQQQDEEDRRAARLFLFARGEELYLHLDTLGRALDRHISAIERYCDGGLDHAGYADARTLAVAGRNEDALARLHLTVRAFFPDLQPPYAELLTLLAGLDTIDRVVTGSAAPAAALLYRISADTSRLRKALDVTLQQLREALVAHVARTSLAAPGGVALAG